MQFPRHNLQTVEVGQELVEVEACNEIRLEIQSRKFLLKSNGLHLLYPEFIIRGPNISQVITSKKEGSY